MRPRLFLTLALSLLCLIALPILAAEPPAPPSADKTSPEAPPPPPSPPPVTWIVEGFKAVGYQWTKQPDHCLKATDLKQAVDYEAELMKFQDWVARSNTPSLCKIVSPTYETPVEMNDLDCLPNPTFAVWAFHLIDGKWVKDEKFCWQVPDSKTSRLDALAYVAKVNAVPGWRATTNAPESTRPAAPTEITFHGPLGWQRYHYTNSGEGSGTFLGSSGGGYPVYSEHGGRTIYRPHAVIRLGRDADWSYSHSEHPTSLWPRYDINGNFDGFDEK